MLLYLSPFVSRLSLRLRVPCMLYVVCCMLYVVYVEMGPTKSRVSKRDTRIELIVCKMVLILKMEQELKKLKVVKVKLI